MSAFAPLSGEKLTLPAWIAPGGLARTTLYLSSLLALR
jgi:hypothetical protein